MILSLKRPQTYIFQQMTHGVSTFDIQSYKFDIYLTAY